MLEEEDLSSNLTSARYTMREETIRSRQPTTARDPASSTTTLRGTDLEAMKRKFPFLLEYSDEFIRDTGVHILIKAETASRKLQDMDRGARKRRINYSSTESPSAPQSPT